MGAGELWHGGRIGYGLRAGAAIFIRRRSARKSGCAVGALRVAQSAFAEFGDEGSMGRGVVPSIGEMVVRRGKNERLPHSRRQLFEHVG